MLKKNFEAKFLQKSFSTDLIWNTKKKKIFAKSLSPWAKIQKKKNITQSLIMVVSSSV